MLAPGHAFIAAAQSNVVPLLTALGGILLGLGGIGGVLTALGNRRNYVQTGFRDLADASAKEAADERAARERAEFSRDRWRDAYYAIRDEAVAAGVSLTTRPPTDHPSEAR